MNVLPMIFRFRSGETTPRRLFRNSSDGIQIGHGQMQFVAQGGEHLLGFIKPQQAVVDKDRR